MNIYEKNIDINIMNIYEKNVQAFQPRIMWLIREPVKRKLRIR